MLAEVAGKDVADGVEVGAAMMGDDALGIARGAGGVTQRDRVPFVVRRSRDEARIALRQRLFIFDVADAPAAGKGAVVDVDNKRLRSRHQSERLGDDAGKFRIDQNEFGAAMIELKRDRRGIEPDVQRVQHRARDRDRKMQLVHGRNVRQHRRDGIAGTDVAAGKVRRQPMAARLGFRPGEDAVLIDRADMVGIDRRRARQKAQWAERNEVGRGLVQPDQILVLAAIHRPPSISCTPTENRSKSTEKSPPRSGRPAAPAYSPRSAGCHRPDRPGQWHRRHSSRPRTAARTVPCPWRG